MSADYREMIRVADHTEVVIIPKAQYDAMKRALEQFADKRNWYYTKKGFRWRGDFDEPFRDAQEALRTMK